MMKFEIWYMFVAFFLFQATAFGGFDVAHKPCWCSSREQPQSTYQVRYGKNDVGVIKRKL